MLGACLPPVEEEIEPDLERRPERVTGPKHMVGGDPGEVVSPVGQRFTLDTATDAVRCLEAGLTEGKSLIVVRAAEAT